MSFDDSNGSSSSYPHRFEESLGIPRRGSDPRLNSRPVQIIAHLPDLEPLTTDTPLAPTSTYEERLAEEQKVQSMASPPWTPFPFRALFGGTSAKSSDSNVEGRQGLMTTTMTTKQLAGQQAHHTKPLLSGEANETTSLLTIEEQTDSLKKNIALSAKMKNGKMIEGSAAHKNAEQTPTGCSAVCAQYFREGSVRGSVFNLCSATLGAGALALPSAFASAGIFPALIFLAVGALATNHSINLLIDAARVTGSRSYEDLTVKVFGKVMGFIVEINIICFCFGTAVAYIIAVGDLLNPVQILIRRSLANNSKINNYTSHFQYGPQHYGPQQHWSGPPVMFANVGTGFVTGADTGTDTPDPLPSSLDGWDWVLSRKGLMIIFWFLIMFPLSLFERVNSLRFTSLLGVLSIAYLVFATMQHSIKHLLNAGYNASWGQAPLWVDEFVPIMEALPIMMFAYTCQVNVFSIYEELEAKSPKRMQKVTRGALYVCSIVYILMGCFGALDFGKATNGNILNNYHITKAGHQDPIMIFAFFAIALTVVMAFPLVIFPCRFTLDVLLFGHPHDDERMDSGDVDTINAGEPGFMALDGNESNPQMQYGNTRQSGGAIVDGQRQASCFSSQTVKSFVLTFAISVSALILALEIRNIKVVFQVMGGTTSAFVCFVLPAAFAIRLQKPLQEFEEKISPKTVTSGTFQKKGTLWVISNYALAVGGVIGGVLGTYASIVDAINSGGGSPQNSTALVL
eukprot:g3171.t1